MIIVGFKTVQDITDTLDAMDKKGWVWCTDKRPREETFILGGRIAYTFIRYKDRFTWGDSYGEIDELSKKEGSIHFKDAIKELLGKKQTEYKVGDIISTEGLVPFEDKTCEELGLKEGDLVVVFPDDYYFKKGEIIELIEDDGDTSPKFTNGIVKHYMYTMGIAPLPIKAKKESIKKVESPVYETIIRRDDGLEFKKGMIGAETIEEIKARRKSLLQDANKITALLKKYDSITF